MRGGVRVCVWEVRASGVCVGVSDVIVEGGGCGGWHK